VADDFKGRIRNFISSLRTGAGCERGEDLIVTNTAGLIAAKKVAK